VDLGHGDVQRRLFVPFELQIGQVEVFGPNAVSHLFGAFDRLGHDRDSLVPESAFVPLESLTACFSLRRIARHGITELAKSDGSLRVEKNEHQIGETFQPVDSCHGRQSRPRR
jgi:hypothetical protein